MRADEKENYFADDKWYEEIYSTDKSPSFSPILPSDLSPNLECSSNGQHLLQDSFEQNANATPQVNSDESIPPRLSALISTSEKTMLFRSSLLWSHIRRNSIMVQDSSNEQHLFLDSLKTFEHNANASPQVTDHGVMHPPTHMGAQPSLGSRSTPPSSSISSIENTKLLFKNLIVLPLEVLSYPENETSMKNVLTILANNLSSFSEEQGDQILGLSLDFPALVRDWRERYSQFQMYSQQASAETVKIRDLVENSGKDEESLKVRYKELENNEKELMKQLEAVQKEKAEIAEQRIEKSKQTKDLKEKAAHRNKEERLMRIATAKLNNLSVQWAKLQSFFI